MRVLSALAATRSYSCTALDAATTPVWDTSRLSSADGRTAVMEMLTMVARARCILVADHDKGTRKLLDRLLRREGYRILLTADGDAAFQQAMHEAPDLALVDIELPGRGGRGLIPSVRDWSDLPVIALTRCPAPATKARALNGGADDCVSKPFDRGELLARVHAQLRRTSAPPPRDSVAPTPRRQSSGRPPRARGHEERRSSPLDEARVGRA